MSASVVTLPARRSALAGPIAGATSEVRRRGGPILVATDGTGISLPALVTARMLAQAHHASVQLIGVVPPRGGVVPGVTGDGWPTANEREHAEQLLQRLRAQREQAGGGDGWSIEIKFGHPPATIARLAKARNASLIVMGRGPHGAMRRLLGDDTVFEVMRLAETPILVAPRPLAEPPRVLTIGVDFTRLSTAAARTAVDLFSDAALTYLVHVGARVPARPLAVSGDEPSHAEWTHGDFALLLEELGPREGMRVDPVILAGNVAQELVDFAAASRTDLLVIGSYRRGLFRRLVGGAMAMRVLAGADCPVLVVPEPAAEAKGAPADVVEKGALRAIFRQFNARNAGRQLMIESDNPRTCTQMLGFECVLLAAEYDVVEDRLQISLADRAEDPEHMWTHSVGHPANVDVRRAADGTDHLARISGPWGSLTLTFS